MNLSSHRPSLGIHIHPVPQSDDQFYAWAKMGGVLSATDEPSVCLVSIKLPYEFEGQTWHPSLTPFSAKLHRIVEDHKTR